MYSYEDRKRAVELYIKYGFKQTAVLRELGYPHERHTLVNWYNEFKEQGDLKKIITRTSKYTNEQIEYAVNYYLEHGRNYQVTIKAIGYPSHHMLRDWVHKLHPEEPLRCAINHHLVDLSRDEKQQAAIELLSRNGSAQELADKYGVSRYSLYNWKWKLIDEDVKRFMSKDTKRNNTKEANELKAEVESLRKEAYELSREVYRLQLEKDVLEKASEIIKKDQGVSLKSLTNREKTIVIDALRMRYALKELLEVFHMAKSTYCYQTAAMKSPDKYSKVRTAIKYSFEKSNGTYGYRRINIAIRKTGINISEKVVRRIMKEDNLIARIAKKRHYNSYIGEISPAVPNILQRDFHSANPNEKWITDITEFAIPAGKVYLSPIIDCFDGLPVSWSIGTSPNADLANSMLDSAISTLNRNEKPIVHSDRGAHYRWPGWIERMEKAGLTRSMSKKGCSPDNSACEGFFGRIKVEMFYGRDWKNTTIEQFSEKLNKYMQWYSYDRIKMSLGGMSPMDYRRSVGLA